MKSGIVLSMLLVSVGLVCPAAWADEDSELRLRQLSAEIKLLQKQIERQEKEIAALRAENLRLKTDSPTRLAGEAMGEPPKAGGASVKVNDSLTDMEALLVADRKLRQNDWSDPRNFPRWTVMTTVQRKDALAAYETGMEKWKERLKVGYYGSNIRWFLRVEDVQPDKESDGYVLLLKSAEGYMATAVFPKERGAGITRLKRGQTVVIEGEILDYKESEGKPLVPPAKGSAQAKPTFFRVSTRLKPSFGVKLAKPRIGKVRNGEVNIASLVFKADNVIYLVDRSGSMTDVFDGLKGELQESINCLSEGQQFQIVLFSEGRQRIFKNWVSATPGNKLRAKDLLEPLIAAGETDAVPAIKDVGKFTRSRKNSAVVLIMDGGVDDMPASLIAAKKLGVPVYALLYGNKPKEAVEFMKRVAKETKGQYRYVRPSD